MLFCAFLVGAIAGNIWVLCGPLNAHRFTLWILVPDFLPYISVIFPGYHRYLIHQLWSKIFSRGRAVVNYWQLGRVG